MRSARTRFLLGSFGLVGSLLVVLAVVLGASVHAQQHVSLDEGLRAELTEFLEVAARGEAEFGEELEQERAGFPFIGWIGTDGAIRFHFGCTAQQLQSLPFAPRGVGVEILGSWQADAESAPTRIGCVQLPFGRVFLGLSEEPADAALRHFAWVAALTVVAVCTVLALGLWRLAARVFDPIATMTDAARRISAEQLDARVPVGTTGDEMDQLAELLNDMLARLERSFTALREFTGHVSHELRTPLTTIRLTLEQAGREAGTDGETVCVAHEVLDTALAELTRLERLVALLLRLARDAAEAPAFETVDLATLCRTTVDAIGPVAEAKGVAIAVEGPERLDVSGNATHLRELLLALLENAVRYTPSGGHVRVACTASAAGVELSVTDDGPGVAADERHRIFDPFTRGTAGSGAEGFGLGLTIARRIARLHHGTLVCADPPTGHGARFIFTCPPAG